MFQQILTRRSMPVITPEALSVFGRWDLPQQFVPGSSPAVFTEEYQELLDFISAATDEVETLAATACLNEQILETYNYFPGHNDAHREFGLEFRYETFPWFYGFPSKDSIELIRRPVIVPSGSPVVNNLTVQFNAPDGTLTTLDPAAYTVQFNKITLNHGFHWPRTDRREDCVQITYWAGYSADDVSMVPSRLKQAIKYLANHMYSVRQIISVEPSSDVGKTLCLMLSSYKSYRIPR